VSLPADLAAAVARAGVNPTLPDRRGYRGDWWAGNEGRWHVEVVSPVPIGTT
jgi:hypothetical protein